jgi:hypothetical protein
MSASENQHTPSPEYWLENPDEDSNDDSSMEAFIARMEAAYASMKTEEDTLNELYQQGKHDELNIKIDNLTDDIVSKNPESIENLAKIKELRSYRDQDKEAIKILIDRQKELYATYRNWIIIESGLPDDARFSEIEKASDNVKDILKRAYPSGEYSPNDALKTLNILSCDDEGKEIYRFPEELVPETTNALWMTYLAAVCKHVKAERDLATHVIDDKFIVGEADKDRTYAHNKITRDLHPILGLEGNQKWDFLSTRGLLAKIRDQVFPTIDSPLSPEGLKLMHDQSPALDAVHRLCAHTPTNH